MRAQSIAFLTLWRREVKRFFRIWTQTLLPQTITILLYFIVFGRVIGDRVGDMQGVSYITFITPGLVMMGVINNSFANVVSSFFGSKFAKNIEEMYVSSMSPLAILMGFVAGGISRGLMIGLLAMAVSWSFHPILIHHLFYLVIVIFLTATVFSLSGLINGIFAKKFDDINFVPVFILTPLTYLGGVFYSIQALPPFWQHVSHINPIFYTVNVFRYSLLGISDVPVVSSVIGLICFTIILFFWAYALVKQGVGVRS